MAVDTDAMICTINLMVSLFVIIFIFFTFLPFQLFTFKRWGFRPARLISLSWYYAALWCATIAWLVNYVAVAAVLWVFHLA